MIDWDSVKPEVTDNAFKIIERAQNSGYEIPNNDWSGLLMDLEATSLNVDIDWESFLNAGEGDFGHDLWGIYENLNRQTGELDNGFLPRFAI